MEQGHRPGEGEQRFTANKHISFIQRKAVWGSFTYMFKQLKTPSGASVTQSASFLAFHLLPGTHLNSIYLLCSGPNIFAGMDGSP
jgi:hypothetical protein